MELPRFQYRTSASLGPGIDIGSIVSAAQGTARGLERAGEAIGEWFSAETKARQEAQLLQGQQQLAEAYQGIRNTVLEDPDIPHNHSDAPALAFRKQSGAWVDGWLKSQDFDKPVVQALRKLAGKEGLQEEDKLFTEGRRRFVDWHENAVQQAVDSEAMGGGLDRAMAVVDEQSHLLGPAKATKLKQGAEQSYWLGRLDKAVTAAAVNEVWQNFEAMGNTHVALDAGQFNKLMQARDAKLEGIKRANTEAEKDAADNAHKYLATLLSQNTLTMGDVNSKMLVLPGHVHEHWVKIVQNLNKGNSDLAQEHLWVEFRGLMLEASNSAPRLNALTKEAIAANKDGKLSESHMRDLLHAASTAINSIYAADRARQTDARVRGNEAKADLAKKQRDVEDILNATMKAAEMKDPAQNKMLADFWSNGKNNPEAWWKKTEKENFALFYKEPLHRSGQQWVARLKELKDIRMPETATAEQKRAHQTNLDAAQEGVKAHERWLLKQKEVFGK